MRGIDYRFLRLNSETLALVEIYPDSDIPEVCQELYLEPPYLTEKRLQLMNTLYDSEQIIEWEESCRFGFNLAVRIAKFYPVIDYSSKLKTEERELVLWKMLDPLTYWDEFCPLFDNEYNLILR